MYTMHKNMCDVASLRQSREQQRERKREKPNVRAAGAYSELVRENEHT